MTSRVRMPLRIAPRTLGLLIGILGLCAASRGGAQPVAAPTGEKPYVVEYYYKARWGYADEFIRLFRKNHLPVLQRELTLGRILKVAAARPRYHATEDGRWDYRVTIVFASARVTDDGFREDVLARELFPDQATFTKEEQRRFEILLAHWDVPVVDVELSP